MFLLILYEYIGDEDIKLVPIVSYLLFRRDQFELHVHINEISLMYVAGRTRGTAFP